MSTSPHLLYSQAAPPYFLCINGDSYFYTKLKQMAFQLRRARKTHRAQPLRLKRKKKSLFIRQAWKFWTFVTNTLLLLSTGFRAAKLQMQQQAQPFSLFCPFKLLVPSEFQPWISWGSWRRKVPSPSDTFAAQENPDLGDRENTQPQLHPRKGSLLCQGETNQIFLHQEGSVLLFSSPKYWGLSSAPLLKSCDIICIHMTVDKWWHFSRESGNHTCPR